MHSQAQSKRLVEYLRLVLEKIIHQSGKAKQTVLFATTRDDIRMKKARHHRISYEIVEYYIPVTKQPNQ